MTNSNYNQSCQTLSSLMLQTEAKGQPSLEIYEILSFLCTTKEFYMMIWSPQCIEIISFRHRTLITDVVIYSNQQGSKRHHNLNQHHGRIEFVRNVQSWCLSIIVSCSVSYNFFRISAITDYGLSMKRLSWRSIIYILEKLCELFALLESNMFIPMLWAIWFPLKQFIKHEKHPWRSDSFSKVTG